MAIREREVNVDQLIHRRRWSTNEYFDLIERGYFDHEHVELMDGEILTMSPMGDMLRGIITSINRVLTTYFWDGYFVTVQSPYPAGDGFVPEPDFAVIAGNDKAYHGVPLPTAELAIEVSESSLQFDRYVKSAVYAKARVPEYWMANVKDLKLEVYRNPTTEGYVEQLEFLTGQFISPLCKPDGSIAVVDLLPRVKPDMQ